MPSNKSRVSSAARAMKAIPSHDPHDNKANTIDLLANLMHYCRAKRLDFDDILDTARRHFEAETN